MARVEEIKQIIAKHVRKSVQLLPSPPVSYQFSGEAHPNLKFDSHYINNQGVDHKFELHYHTPRAEKLGDSFLSDWPDPKEGYLDAMFEEGEITSRVTEPPKLFSARNLKDMSGYMIVETPFHDAAETLETTTPMSTRNLRNTRLSAKFSRSPTPAQAPIPASIAVHGPANSHLAKTLNTNHALPAVTPTSEQSGTKHQRWNAYKRDLRDCHRSLLAQIISAFPVVP